MTADIALDYELCKHVIRFPVEGAGQYSGYAWSAFSKYFL